MIFWLLLILAVVGVALATVVASMRNSGRKVIPAVVPPEAARRHRAVVYLIRGTEIAVAVPILALIALIGLGFFFSINPFRSQTAGSEAYSVIMLIAFLVVVAGIVGKSINRYRNFGWGGVFRNVNFLKVDTNSISNFAFFLAAFAAHDLYHYLPPTNHTAGHQPPGLAGIFLDRDILWIIAFWGIWRLTKSLLFRLLELNAPSSPQSPPPTLPRTFHPV